MTYRLPCSLYAWIKHTPRSQDFRLPSETPTLKFWPKGVCMATAHSRTAATDGSTLQYRSDTILRHTNMNMSLADIVLCRLLCASCNSIRYSIRVHRLWWGRTGGVALFWNILLAMVLAPYQSPSSSWTSLVGERTHEQALRLCWLFSISRIFGSFIIYEVSQYCDQRSHHNTMQCSRRASLGREGRKRVQLVQCTACFPGTAV